MPSLPDIPGKDLVTGIGRRAGKVAAASGLTVIAIGGYVVRRLVRRGKEADAPAPKAEEPPTTTGTDAPPQPEAEPGDISQDKEPHPATGAESTSEPHTAEDPEAGERAEPPEREKLDD